MNVEAADCIPRTAVAQILPEKMKYKATTTELNMAEEKRGR